MLRDSLSQGATRAKLANHHKNKKKTTSHLDDKVAHYSTLQISACVCGCVLTFTAY